MVMKMWTEAVSMEPEGPLAVCVIKYGLVLDHATMQGWIYRWSDWRCRLPNVH